MRKLLCLLMGVAATQQVATAQVTDTSARWIWKAGTTSTALMAPSYPAKNSPESANTKFPGSRTQAVTWTDKDGNLYLFSGFYNLQNTFCDVWKYNPNDHTWAWINGPSGYTTSDGSTAAKLELREGVFGAKGELDASFFPGCRGSAASWVDNKGNVWVFGGWRVENGMRRNDLWKYEIATNRWAWMNGDATSGVSTTNSRNGVYGVKGVADVNNQPGGRGYGRPATWIDHKNGNLYMFGGSGFDRSGSVAYNAQRELNDLWVYDINNNVWTWIGGSDVAPARNTEKRYGVLGVEDPANYPHARANAACWQDDAGMFWMYGGLYSEGTTTRTNYILNDLWRYNPVSGNWTWMGGDSVVAVTPPYLPSHGIRGAQAAANYPGARQQAQSWVGVDGKLWLYGGWGYGSAGNGNVLNDLWRYDPVTGQWTWMWGDTDPTTATGGRIGTYSAGVGNVGRPGSRRMGQTWVDLDGNFWLQGGQGTLASANNNFRGDLWKLEAIVVPPPSQPAAFTTGKNAVCQGENGVTYTVPSVSGATSYEWKYTGSNVTYNTTSTTPSNSLSFANNATDGVLSVRAINASGSSPWRDTAIKVNPLPTVSFTSPANPSPICEGDSSLLTVSATSGVDYQWKMGTTNVGPNNNSFYAKEQGVYTVTVTTAANCSATTNTSVTVTINPLPTVSIAPASVTICEGQTASLTASGATTYSWSPAGGSAATANVAPTATTTYTVTGTASGCSATATAQVTVNPLPAVAVNNTGSQAICAGDSLLLSVNNEVGVNYEWKQGTTVVGTGNEFYAKTAGTYTVTATNSTTNCAATSAATVLTVNPLPVVTLTPAGPTEFCTQGSVVLDATPATAMDYQWLHNGSAVGTNANSYLAEAAGAYIVVVSDQATGCSDTSSAVAVVVNDLPSVTLTPGDTAFCEGGVVNLLVATQDTGLTFVWKNNGTTIPLASAYFLEVSETGVYSVEVGRIGIAGCESITNEVAVTVYPRPVVNITWDGEAFHATPGYETYQWYSAGQAIPGAADSTFVPSEHGGYSVQVTDDNNCTATSPVYNVVVDVNDVVAIQTQTKVYPNPATAVLFIDAPIAVNAYLTSIDGKLLFQGTDVRQINLSQYNTGVYLLRITDKNGVIIRYEKVVKQ